MSLLLISAENFCSKCRVYFTSNIFQRRLSSRIYPRPQMVEENRLVLKELGIPEKSIKFTKYVSRNRRLKLSVDVIKKLGFTVEDLKKNIAILGCFPTTVDHRFKALEEGGVSTEAITLKMIRRYTYLTSKSISSLKSQNLIPKKIDVLQNILSFSDMPPNLFPSGYDEASSFRKIRMIAMKKYLIWRLNRKEEEIDNALEEHFLMQNRSLRMMTQVCSILINNIGMSPEQIIQNGCLLYSHPDKLLTLLESFPFIGEKPIRSILLSYPKMLSLTAEKLQETVTLLEEYKISAQSISLNPHVLVLSVDTIRERLEKMSADPVFQPYLYSPRICTLLLHYNTAKSRMKILKESKWRSQSLNMMSYSRPSFEATLKLGAEFTMGTDTIMYLHKQLHMKRKEVRGLLIQHPFWNYVPVATVSATLSFLRDAGYSHSQIVEALPVLFYPKSEVARQLKELLEEEIEEVDCCRDPVTGEIQPQLVLQLVLYYLERPYHFTGNGVWALHSLEKPSADLASQEDAQ